MKIIETKNLYSEEYSIVVINALKQFWRSSNTFNCLGNPKKNDMLIYFDGCRAVYTLKNGETFLAERGSVVYIPTNSEYRVRFFDFLSDSSNTVHINFRLYDKAFKPFLLSDKIEILNADNADYKAIFNRLDGFSEANVICRGKIKSLAYDLIHKLSESYYRDLKSSFHIIEKGIEYLEKEDEQTKPISEIAEMCNVSEVYFRRLFKEYSGFSPAKYRTNAKIFRAKNYLKQNELSVSEISDRLGFGDVSYFIKIFKEHTSLTPKEYREKTR